MTDVNPTRILSAEYDIRGGSVEGIFVQWDAALVLGMGNVGRWGVLRFREGAPRPELLQIQSIEQVEGRLDTMEINLNDDDLQSGDVVNLAFIGMSRVVVPGLRYEMPPVP